jgi:acyl-CoA synthetase (AMP-forming)/AMP-acid ligase II
LRFNHAELFAALAAELPDEPCIVFRARRLTFGQVAERTRRLANLLLEHALTIRRRREDLSLWESGQDHVALYLHNGNEYLEGMLGAAAARAVSINVNYRYVEDELAYLLDDAAAGAVVFHSTFASTLAPVIERLRKRPRLLLQVADESGADLLPGAFDYEDALAASSPDAPPTQPDPDDLYVLYTGGTTGMPKGTLWAQADMAVSALAGILPEGLFEASTVADAVELIAAAERRVVLVLAPLMHGAGQWLALGGLLSGSTVVFPDVVDRLDPASVWRTIDREGVQVMSFVGNAFAAPLFDEFEKGHHSGASLEFVGSGGAVTSAMVKDRILRLLPDVCFVDAAGSSESGSQLSNMSTPGAPATSGIFTPTPDTCVVNEDRTRVLAPGEQVTGWLARHGAIPFGYLGDRPKTERTFPTIEGRRMVLSGDRARHRADGTIELLGRDAATINSGGEKIFAEEVEEALIGHPAVADVIVVGRPSERWGNEVVAVLQLAHGEDPTDEELLAHAGRCLARYKLPKAIVRVPTVMRGPAGKADYRWAREVALEDARPAGQPAG